MPRRRPWAWEHPLSFARATLTSYLFLTTPSTPAALTASCSILKTRSGRLRRWRGCSKSDAVLLEHSRPPSGGCPRQRHREVERGLAAERGEQRVGALLL